MTEFETPYSPDALERWCSVYVERDRENVFVLRLGAIDPHQPLARFWLTVADLRALQHEFRRILDQG
jgi:hypothetical protein